MKNKPEPERCVHCQLVKPDVKLRIDPYQRDVEGVENKSLLCQTCIMELADDI